MIRKKLKIEESYSISVRRQCSCGKTSEERSCGWKRWWFLCKLVAMVGGFLTNSIEQQFHWNYQKRWRCDTDDTTQSTRNPAFSKTLKQLTLEFSSSMEEVLSPVHGMLSGFFNLLGISKRWRNEERESFQRGRRIDSQAQKEADEMRRDNRNIFPGHFQTFRLQSVRPQSLYWCVEPTMWTIFCITVKLEKIGEIKRLLLFWQAPHQRATHTLIQTSRAEISRRR